jgi:magnesium-transporting ATPase (P-type)
MSAKIRIIDVDISNVFYVISFSFGVIIGELIYQAQSPDEGALVNAARNFGFVFRVSSQCDT